MRNVCTNSKNNLPNAPYRHGIAFSVRNLFFVPVKIDNMSFKITWIYQFRLQFSHLCIFIFWNMPNVLHKYFILYLGQTLSSKTVKKNDLKHAWCTFFQMFIFVDNMGSIPLINTLDPIYCVTLINQKQEFQCMRVKFNTLPSLLPMLLNY